MKKLSAILFILLFSFCSNKEKHKYPRITTTERESVIKVNSRCMLHTSLEYDGRYLGLNFSNDTIIGIYSVKKYDYSYSHYKWDSISQRYDLKLIIDTSYTIAANGFEHKNLYLMKWVDFYKIQALYNNFVECYPLLIFNKGNKNAQGHYLKFIQQAKDTDGKWKPIEFFEDKPGGCIPMPTENYTYLPKKYTGFSIIKYHGNFKTKLRIKARIGDFYYYSNEIDGYINRTQFDTRIAREMLNSLSTVRPVSDDRLNYSLLENEIK